MGMPYRYQYETSPRKVKPEYTRKPKKYPKKSSMTRKKVKIEKNVKKEFVKKAKIIFLVLFVFSIVFAISYRNSLINEAYSKTEGLKSNLEKIERENEQIEVSIDNSLNLANIEQSAKELLGMTKLTSKQTIYITLPKQDYIESDSNKANEKKKRTFLDFLKDIF